MWSEWCSQKLSWNLFSRAGSCIKFSTQNEPKYETNHFLVCLLFVDASLPLARARFVFVTLSVWWCCEFGGQERKMPTFKVSSIKTSTTFMNPSIQHQQQQHHRHRQCAAVTITIHIYLYGLLKQMHCVWLVSICPLLFVCHQFFREIVVCIMCCCCFCFSLLLTFIALHSVDHHTAIGHSGHNHNVLYFSI